MKNEYIPQLSTIKNVVKHTDLEYTFSMEFKGDVRPGQFLKFLCQNTGKHRFLSVGSEKIPSILRSVASEKLQMRFLKIMSEILCIFVDRMEMDLTWITIREKKL